ncbi:hypothetical protein [Peribacillus sp. ACCC06369]|uniref:hypothetical protein n=1 Tax=Peribacillus sp. ACCC06369 TaxID=3055860 RepID=UPI0025A0B132|nr:hypothetical protein [Peribacillus sp. ACCC06369]
MKCNRADVYQATIGGCLADCGMATGFANFSMGNKVKLNLNSSLKSFLLMPARKQD